MKSIVYYWKDMFNTKHCVLYFSFGYIMLALFLLYRNYFGLGAQLTDPVVIIFFAFWSIAMFVPYGLFVLRGKTKFHLKNILLWHLFFSAILIFIWPFTSNDIFNYIFRAKVFTEYGVNPFVVPPGFFQGDVLTAFVWEQAQRLPMVYGPVWAMISFLPTYIFGHNIPGALFLFKIIVVSVNVGNILLIYNILKTIAPKYKNFGTLLYAFNPLVIFEFALNGHNDAVMIFFLLLASFLFVRKQYLWVMPALMFSVLSKFLTLLVVPIFFVFLFKKIQSKKFLFFTKSFLLSAVVAVFAYAPFWEGLKTFETIWNLQGFVKTNLLFPTIFHTIIDIPFSRVQTILKVVFVASYAWLLYMSMTKKSFSVFKGSFWVLFLYLFVATPWLQSWYFTWLVAPLAIIGESKYRIALVGLTAVAFGGYYLSFIITTILFVFIVFGVIFFKKFFSNEAVKG